jgi:hypothetical protein
MAQILNNVIVWMVQKLLVHFFEIQKENQLKVDSNELKVN